MDDEEVSFSQDDDLDARTVAADGTVLTHFKNNGTSAKAWVVALCKTRAGTNIAVPGAFSLQPGGGLSEQPFILETEQVVEFHVEYVESGRLVRSKAAKAGRGKYFSYIGGWWVPNSPGKDLLALLGKPVTA